MNAYKTYRKIVIYRNRTCARSIGSYLNKVKIKVVNIGIQQVGNM
jgi:hypothetical protein